MAVMKLHKVTLDKVTDKIITFIQLLFMALRVVLQ